MQGRSLVESLLAVAGIWLVARQIPDYATSLLLMATGDLPVSGAGPSVLATQGIHFLVSAIAGLILIFSRKLLAEWFLPEEAKMQVGAEPLFAAGIGVVGVYFIISGALTLWQLMWPGSSYPLWSGILSMLLGLGLFFATPWITRLWGKLNGVQ